MSAHYKYIIAAFAGMMAMLIPTLVSAEEPVLAMTDAAVAADYRPETKRGVPLLSSGSAKTLWIQWSGRMA